MNRDERYRRIFRVVRRIPRGRVATYGQIAASAGLPRHARQVGFALRSLPDESDVPWHRVVGADGSISRRSYSDSHELQKLLLQSEGIVVNADRIDLDRYRWEPDDKPRL